MLPILLLIILVATLYWKFSKATEYWQKLGVPYEKPVFFFGNIAGVIFQKTSMAEFLNNLYRKHWDKRYVGTYVFSKPAIMLRDPELIRLVCVKEFETFPRRFTIASTDTDPIWSNTLFAMPGEKSWKYMRAVLSPMFTSGKLRTMFGLINHCVKRFNQHLTEQGGFVKLEMKDTFSKVTNDIIASTAFGVTCDSIRDPKNEIFEMGKDVSNFGGFWKSLKFFVLSISPKLAKLLKVRFISTNTASFFSNIIREAVQTREKLSLVREDLIHLLMEARKNGRIEITDDIMTSQAIGFFLGGFDTVSTALCYTAYELALNYDIQRRLIQEVDDTLKECNEEITYDGLLGMKYLDMVISEALRKWPPLAITDRGPSRSFKIQSDHHDEPLGLDTNIVCQIPILAIHRDAQYYPEPEKFDPERFSDVNKNNIKPYTYLPFGVGPRVCIGLRFALLEVKIVIFNILTKFEIVPVEETPVPLIFSKANVNPVSDKGYWLGFKPRT